MIPLYKWKTITTSVMVNSERDEFIALIKEHKPNAIYCSHWSEKHPFILITNLQEDVVTYHYSDRVFENPKVRRESLSDFYRNLTTGGYSLSYMSLATIE